MLEDQPESYRTGIDDDLEDVPPDGTQNRVGDGLRGASWVRTANIPASETKPGQITEALTPVPWSSMRKPLVQAISAALVAA